MENILIINSLYDNLFFDNFFPLEKADYFCFDTVKTKEGESRYSFVVKLKTAVKATVFAEKLAKWLLLKYKHNIIKDVLKERFISFSPEETAKIIENTENSLKFFDKVYGEKLIVKKITNFFMTNQTLNINGFLRFRIKEYRRAVEMFLFEAIEELQVKNEYNEFIELLKAYIDSCSSLIDFIHIKTDISGKILFYDFKKTEILFETENKDSIEIFSTRDDLVMNILISLAPKRILWHTNSRYPDLKIFNTLKEIFGDRISLCNGCELCIE